MGLKEVQETKTDSNFGLEKNFKPYTKAHSYFLIFLAYVFVLDTVDSLVRLQDSYLSGINYVSLGGRGDVRVSNWSVHTRQMHEKRKKQRLETNIK